MLDYVIGDEVWEKVERVKVRDKIESNHFPVVVWIKGGGGHQKGRRREKEEMEVDRGG